jgi:hypothetical protein
MCNMKKPFLDTCGRAQSKNSTLRMLIPVAHRSAWSGMVFFMFKESLMNACRAAFAGALGMLLASLVGTSAAMAADPPGRDAVLDWNAVALEAVVHDHSGTFGPAVQGGPTRTSRALAIVHAAIFGQFHRAAGDSLRQEPPRPGRLD